MACEGRGVKMLRLQTQTNDFLGQFDQSGLAKPLSGPGLGISININKLDAMTISREVLQND